MRTLRFLLQKEFRQIFRNSNILRIILIMPIVQLVVIPLAADYEVKNIRLSIVDHDHSSYSRDLVDKVLASGYFKLNDAGHSFEAAFEEFQKDRSDLILEIPEGFERDLIAEQGAQLFMAANAINGVKAGVGSAYLGQIIARFNAHIRTEWNPSGRFPVMPSLDVHTLNWYNPHMRYQNFMVPGILVILVTMIGAYMCALNIVKEKEVGTIEQINVTPIKKTYFILGKLIPFWVIGIFVFSLGLFGVGYGVYGIWPAGSILALYAFLGVYLIALLGVGLIISTYSNTQQQAMSLAFFLMMIFILMSGLFTSIDSMPEWAQWIAYLNPATHFIEVARLIVLNGSGFAAIGGQFLVIGVMAIVFNAWAVLNYRKTA